MYSDTATVKDFKKNQKIIAHTGPDSWANGRTGKIFGFHESWIGVNFDRKGDEAADLCNDWWLKAGEVELIKDSAE